MQTTTFTQLNHGWNAEPNSPGPLVEITSTTLRLSFFLTPFLFEACEEEVAQLTFTGVRRWRLGPTNDEGWYRGQCRYGPLVPAWGEFYEIGGDDPLRDQQYDWMETIARPPGGRHFLFYFRDETFECLADDWVMERGLTRATSKDAW